MQLVVSGGLPAPSFLQGCTEHGRARLRAWKLNQFPSHEQGQKASWLADVPSSTLFPLGFICALLQDAGWKSCKPAGRGADYSHFLSLLTLCSRFSFLNPQPSISFVVLFGGDGSLAAGWCLLQGVLSHSRPTQMSPGYPCMDQLCFWVQ